MKTMKTIQTIQTFMAILCVFALSNCSPEKKAERIPLDYNLPYDAYQPRLTSSDPSTWKPIDLKVEVPTGGITLSDNGVFKPVLERNINYLLHSFSTDHILYPFRERAGKEVIPDERPQVGFWDTDLRGSNAGRFMMGAGNTLRWIEHPELRKMLNDVIDGIEACREPDGYILAYPHVIDSLRSEEPNYARAWFTHGLLDAALAGNPKAYGLLRGHADWFNQWEEIHPKLLHWNNNSHQGHIAQTRTYLSPIGKTEDLQVAEKAYVCDWWMDELADHQDFAVWQYPLQNPHSYLITSFEAYLDHYIATGDKTYLDAMLGAWDLIHDNWEHVGGSMAICESQWNIDEEGNRTCCRHAPQHPPKSYYIKQGHTGETCGSVFWIKFNQRLHRLYPNEEKYTTEIEKSIYNVILACQQEDGNIAYHAKMEGKREHPTHSTNTCCEGQGTRMLGSLPEYIYSIVPDGLYVNLYEPSAIDFKVKDKTVRLTQESQFPFKPEVSLKVSASTPVKMKLHIRVPSWASQAMDISINGKKTVTGKPGAYVELSRKWEDGDQIAFTLPMDYKVTPYEGIDSQAGFQRAGALEYGPILMAYTKTSVTDEPEESGSFDVTQLRPDAAHPLQFNISDDSKHVFMPYWLVPHTQSYYIYPVQVQRDE
jgi:DUF1680 family protein